MRASNEKRRPGCHRGSAIQNVLGAVTRTLTSPDVNKSGVNNRKHQRESTRKIRQREISTRISTRKYQREKRVNDNSTRKCQREEFLNETQRVRWISQRDLNGIFSTVGFSQRDPTSTPPTRSVMKSTRINRRPVESGSRQRDQRPKRTC